MRDDLDLTGLTDADLSAVIERAELLRDWIALNGSDTLLGVGDLYSPVLVADIIGATETDCLRAGLAAGRRVVGLLTLGVGLSGQFRPDRLVERCLFESLREVDRVLLQEAVAGLTVDRGHEGAAAPSDMAGGGARIGVDGRSDQTDDVSEPHVHDPRELLAGEGDLLGGVGPLGHGHDLLARLRERFALEEQIPAGLGDSAPSATDTPTRPTHDGVAR